MPRADFTRSVKPMIAAALILQFGATTRASVWSLIAHSGAFAKGILLVLFVLSIWCWAIIWNRLRLYSRVERADQHFLKSFRALQPGADCRLLCEQHPESLLARVALAGQRAIDQLRPDAGLPLTARYEVVQHAMDRCVGDETASLERHVGFLGTTGSVSPFIGLLGTVWGVMSAFLNIGAQGSASLVVVAPGIAEALIATIAGLAAAIPAVVGYNHCLGRLRDLTQTTTQFATEFLDRRLGGRAE
jgi:biopolymer transport protein TolQ